MLFGEGSLVHAQEEEGAVAHVEPDPTWRDALSARLRSSDQHISDEEIFAILNGGSEGVTAAELCAARGVTVPMYCVWKSKYRQLRSEEHTSELQSQSNLVCRLLLEKKKKNQL